MSIFQVQGEVVKVQSKMNRAVRVTIDTQEALSDESMARLMALLEKTGWFCFLPEERPIDELDIVSLPPVEWEEESKSPAQRMRGTLYILWKQKGEAGDFTTFYKSMMEKMIDKIKEKLT